MAPIRHPPKQSRHKKKGLSLGIGWCRQCIENEKKRRAASWFKEALDVTGEIWNTEWTHKDGANFLKNYKDEYTLTVAQVSSGLHELGLEHAHKIGKDLMTCISSERHESKPRNR